MLQLSKSFINQPVLSLRSGAPVGTALEPIINPNNLRIEGWYVQDRFNKQRLILLTKDVRDIIGKGIVVDDADVLSKPDELLRLQEVMSLKFELLNKLVVSDLRRHIGKISDYSVDMDSLFIQKLYVNQPIFRSLNDGQVIVDRSQIIEITPKRIVVRDVDEKVTATSPMPASA